MRCKVLKSAMGLPMCTGDHTGPDASVGLYYGMTVVGQRARCRSAKCESLASCGRPSSRLRPNPQIETLAMQPPQDREDRLVAAAVDGLWFGVWIGVAVLTILLALFDWHRRLQPRPLLTQPSQSLYPRRGALSDPPRSSLSVPSSRLYPLALRGWGQLRRRYRGRRW